MNSYELFEISDDSYHTNRISAVNGLSPASLVVYRECFNKGMSSIVGYGSPYSSQHEITPLQGSRMKHNITVIIIIGCCCQQGTPPPRHCPLKKTMLPGWPTPIPSRTPISSCSHPGLQIAL